MESISLSEPESQPLTHLDADGAARMVDVGDKDRTERIARASGLVEMKPETLSRIQEGEFSKGDVCR